MMADHFYSRALAASHVDPSSLYEAFDDADVRLVAQLMEIDAKRDSAMKRISALREKHRGDRRYLARCRETEKKINTDLDIKKRDLLMLWHPGLHRAELNH